MRRDRYITEEKLRERVSAWIRVKNLIKVSESKVPQGRIKWKEAIDKHLLIKEATGWADLEDKAGLFICLDGKKIRRTVFNENGDMINDTFELAQTRLKSRLGNGNGGNGKNGEKAARTEEWWNSKHPNER
jgi:hypothetical protein